MHTQGATSITPATDTLGRRRRVCGGGTDYLTDREIGQRLGISTTTLWRMRRRREIPEPVRLSPGRVAWRRAEIEAWLASRTPSTDDTEAAG